VRDKQRLQRQRTDVLATRNDDILRAIDT
jgi:hypothetical protein